MMKKGVRRKRGAFFYGQNAGNSQKLMCGIGALHGGLLRLCGLCGLRAEIRCGQIISIKIEKFQVIGILNYGGTRNGGQSRH